MLNIVYSNDTSQLATCLADKLVAEPLPPLHPEVIIVQSNELSRWLSLKLAHDHGIAANLEFPFPSAYIWRLFRQIWSEVPLQSPYAKESLTWRLFSLLPELAGTTGFDAVTAYLGPQPDELKCFELSLRIADTFDQYLMYRPDWIAEWEQGNAGHWQGQLWQRLSVGDSNPMHRARLLQQLADLLAQSEIALEGLPSRLSIFGISALPPVYLQLFELLARFVDITLYYLSPSEHYWGDLMDSKQQQRQQLALDFELVPSDPGHPLLASLGKQGQAFFRQLQETRHEADSFFVEPAASTMLEQVKQDMFQMEVGASSSVAAGDDSIQIHVCHSAMREMEVLHDQLLALFERHPDLSPTDIVVMTPDIEDYAPWIEAVFGAANGDLHIPFSIADSGGQRESPLLNSLFTLLDLPQSRFEVTTVLSLLECPALQHRFGLDGQTLFWVRQWLQQTRTRWGLDEADKTRLELPASMANTWRAGLDRLLLGYAMPLNEPGHSWQLFDDQLAMDGINGERAQRVADLCRFIDTLDHWRQQLSRSYTARQWQRCLNECLQAFFLPSADSDDGEEAELIAIRRQLNSLVDSTNAAQFEATIGLDVIKSWLQSHLEAVDNSQRFLGHGVTFCGMVPMRSVPFNVICLVGMNDEVFPRRQPGLGFDLLAQHYREGDRSRRDDDRYLFLEAIVSAQSHLYISYVGASILDNAEIPPSVLVSDLQDLLDERFSRQQGASILNQLVTHHPLQAFSRRYFDQQDARLFSYQAGFCPDLTQQQAEPDWFAEALPEADESWRQASLSQLIHFFAHPARFLLRERLGLTLELEEDELETREPFGLSGLDAWQLRQHMLETRLSVHSDEGLKAVVEATGILPLGHIGDECFDRERRVVDEFVAKLSPVWPQQPLSSLPFELDIDGFNLSGQLEKVSEQGLFRYRLANTKGRDLIAAWLEHLILNIVRPVGVQLTSRLVMQDADYLLQPVTGPTQILADLLQLYWQGCHQPLPFFDKASLAFAKASLGGKPEQAFIKANNVWAPDSDWGQAERDDVYYRQVYSHNPLDEQFAELALKVYGPLQQHLQEGSL